MLFDLDGTLVDSFADIRRSVAAAFAEVGVVASEELLGQVRRGIGLEEFYCHATEADSAAPAEAPRFAAFVAAYRRHYFLDYVGAAYPGVAEGLATLERARPFLMRAVATAKRTEVAKVVLARAGLASEIDVVRGSDGLPQKPDPAVLVAAAGAAGRHLEAAVMVGDTDRDLGAARAAGCGAVAVTWGGMSRSELDRHGPDLLVDSFADLVDWLLARA